MPSFHAHTQIGNIYDVHKQVNSWPCPQCSNSNWWNNLHCTVCNFQRPLEDSQQAAIDETPLLTRLQMMGLQLSAAELSALQQNGVDENAINELVSRFFDSQG